MAWSTSRDRARHSRWSLSQASPLSYALSAPYRPYHADEPRSQAKSPSRGAAGRQAWQSSKSEVSPSSRATSTARTSSAQYVPPPRLTGTSAGQRDHPALGLVHPRERLASYACARDVPESIPNRRGFDRRLSGAWSPMPGAECKRGLFLREPPVTGWHRRTPSAALRCGTARPSSPAWPG